jgi:hypothetical protein
MRIDTFLISVANILFVRDFLDTPFFIKEKTSSPDPTKSESNRDSIHPELIQQFRR